MNTQGVMSGNVGVYDIVEVLNNKFNVHTIVEEIHDEFYHILFTYRNEDRRLAVFLNYSDSEVDKFIGEGSVTLIDLNMWGYSIELTEGIVAEFGGYVVDNDCKGDWRHIGSRN